MDKGSNITYFLISPALLVGQILKEESQSLFIDENGRPAPIDTRNLSEVPHPSNIL